jgi:hypothetical protein
MKIKYNPKENGLHTMGMLKKQVAQMTEKDEKQLFWVILSF